MLEYTFSTIISLVWEVTAIKTHLKNSIYYVVERQTEWVGWRGGRDFFKYVQAFQVWVII